MKSLTKEEIKDRLIRRAADHWGVDDMEIEYSFDPIVGILFDACAHEFERISETIKTSRTKVTERLVDLLTPEISVTAKPAHAVMHALPIDNKVVINERSQFFHRKRMPLFRDSGKEDFKDFFFCRNLFICHYATTSSLFSPLSARRFKKGTFLRKALVVTQFAVSIALITGTFIVYNQFSFMQNQELGFNVSQNLVLNAPMDVDSTAMQRIKLFKDEVRRNPNINSASMTNEVPGKPIMEVSTIRKRGDETVDGTTASFLEVDHDFLKTYGVGIIAGRDFVKEDVSNYDPRIDSSDNPNLYRVLINRATAKALGFASPEAALNQKVVYKYGPVDRTAEVIGVVENYHQQSLESDYDKILFLYPSYYFGEYLTVNVSGKNVAATVASIEQTFNNVFHRDPFNYFFLDEHFNMQYQADQKFGFICLLFSILAIFIAALGLFGLGSHIAMQKVKEISVRKVLGASTFQALVLIPQKLLGLILVSGAIAIPIVYFILKNWLEGYAFKIDMTLWMFLVPVIVVLLVALISILSQSLKTAWVNPADSLRND